MQEAFAGDLDATAGWLDRLAEAGATWAILLVLGGTERIDMIGRGTAPSPRRTRVSDDASHRLKARKRAVRRAAIARRDLLNEEERSTKSERIVERVLALPEVGAARTVMAFWSFGSEVRHAP